MRASLAWENGNLTYVQSVKGHCAIGQEDSMKIIYNTLCFVFCVLTLGFVNLRVHYSDGTEFKWVGWITRIESLMEQHIGGGYD